MRLIAIIGAGVSGRLLALNLLRFAPSKAAVNIQMFDRGDEHYMGPAYSDDAHYLLLNVPAGRMGAVSEDPEHFLKWAQGRGVRAGQWDFLPRRLYSDYVLDLMHEVRRQRTDGPLFAHVRGEVTDIELARGGVRIHMEEAARSFIVDKAVLALGNFPPCPPPALNPSALRSGRYVWNPWNTRVLDSLAQRDIVVLIGTGQTMVDLTVALYQRGHKGRIVAISRRGLLPLAHQSFESYPSFFEEIKNLSRRSACRRSSSHTCSSAVTGTTAAGRDPGRVRSNWRLNLKRMARGRIGQYNAACPRGLAHRVGVMDI
jgi:uncharacterized NAD(P)/FAD-binding protein YdhS